jgi:L-fuculose-phosphate aldolase
MKWSRHRDQIVEICRRMYARRLVSGGQGNVSVRLDPESILITPSGVNKGFIQADDLVVADMDGRPVDPGRVVSSEVKVHLAAYRRRPDCAAVVHAHPMASVALTLAGVSLEPVYLPESVITLGIVPTGTYATPSSAELADGVDRLAGDHNVIMMERHGAVCLGSDLSVAYDRLESLEHNAMIVLMASMLGSPGPLPAGEIEKLRAIAARLPY